MFYKYIGVEQRNESMENKERKLLNCPVRGFGKFNKHLCKAENNVTVESD